MTTQVTMSGRAWGLMAALGLIWGGSFPATAIVLTEMTVWTTVALRVTIAGAILWALVLALRLPLPRTPRDWALMLTLGVIGNAVPFSLITWGQTSVPAGLAAILNASTAMFGVLVAAAFFPDERLTWRKGLGVVLGIAGIVIAMGWAALSRLDLTALGQLALVAASFCYAMTNVVGRMAVRGVAPQVVATGMMTGAMLIMLPVALVVDGLPSAEHSLRVWSALAYSAVIATALAYFLFYRLIAVSGASIAGLITFLVAPVAIVIGAVLLDEALPLRAYLGFGVLALGLAVLDGRLITLLAPRDPPG
jgi:drug/metabolite transporter (DMT)-like permease